MAALELDPLFVKALKLLHSKTRDSAIQLKQMLDDAISLRKSEVGSSKQDGEIQKPFQAYKPKEKSSESKKRESDKRSYDKVKNESSDSSDAPIKKPKLESGKTTPKNRSPDRDRSSKEKSKQPRMLQEIDIFKPQAERDKEVAAMARERERERQKEKVDKPDRKEVRKAIITSDTDDSEDASDDDEGQRARADSDSDLGLEMDGVSCVVCKSVDVKGNNAMVECQECHDLYHQECHRPPVTENVNDPRFVWYCSKCSKSMKKMAAKPQKPKVGAPIASKDSLVSKPNKSEPSLFPFRRQLDTSKPSSTSISKGDNYGAPRPLGLAGLAANLSGKSADSKSVKQSGAFHAFSKAAESSLKHSSSTSKLSNLGTTSSSSISRSGSSTNLGKMGGISKSSSSSKSGEKSSSTLNPDKRLHSVKKKTASKGVEKRAHFK